MAIRFTEPSVAPQLAFYDRALPEADSRAMRLWVEKFFPFQQRWLLDANRFAVCNKSRKLGLTLSSAACGVIWGAFHRETTTVISVGQDEADEVIDTARKHARIMRELGSTLCEVTKHTKEEIRFKKGGRILALPSTGGRSYTGNVFLDEFAHQGHATEVWKAAAPVAMLGNKMRVISTPNGVGNEFHDLIEFALNPEAASRTTEGFGSVKWSLHEIPIEDAIAEGYRVDIAACWALAKGDPRIFAQEFQCSFLDAQFQYVPTDDITAALTTEPMIELEADANTYDYYAGLDIGREVDLSCLIVIRVHRRTGAARIVYLQTIKRTDTKALHEMVDYAFKRYKLRRLCIDATGLGSFPAQDIKKKHSELYDVDYRRPRVEPIDFTLQSKEDLATGLYSAVTKKTILLPGCNAALMPATRITDGGAKVVYNEADVWKKLKKEIASVQRKVTKAANVVYETPRTREGHADRAWALMLALYARDPIHPMLLALQGTPKS